MNPRIALIGCGAVAEQCHLPALVALKISPAALIEPNLKRLHELSSRYPAPCLGDDYRLCLDAFDAAIVAVPHHLHAPLCLDLLQRGIHVLVEKPLAPTVADCQRLIATAGSAVLAVGLKRRYWQAGRWLQAALAADLLGSVRSFDFEEGSVYQWPISSDFFFRKESSGGGVLMDAGAHVLDQLLDWLGSVRDCCYRDDSRGGLEAEAELQIVLESGATGTVRLSRLRELRNTAIIRGERGEIEIDLDGNGLRAQPAALLQRVFRNHSGLALSPQDMLAPFIRQIQEWLACCQRQETPALTHAAVHSIALIERCYSQRQPLRFPWEEEAVGVAG